MSTGVNIPFSESSKTIADVLAFLDVKLGAVPPPKTVSAVITNSSGKEIFRLDNVEAPESWSQLSINIVAEKFFRKGTTPETSVYKMCMRISGYIAEKALSNGYIDEQSVGLFDSVLYRLLLKQMFSFNSPVWFNVGVHDNPRISACFILGIKDTMESILNTAMVEGMIYKYGSGSGINFSPLRGKNEGLSRGGVSSGVLSFMDIGDAVAGSIKSGGTTRRAAKMACLDVDHPDIEDFINCKLIEEQKAKALIDAGYSDDFRDDNGAYASIKFQNANNSVRVSNEFMDAVRNDSQWALIGRVPSTKPRIVQAKDLFDSIAEAAWKCGDPGLQFDTTVNSWNTLKTDGKINGSNPCSEYMSLDNTSCNLASVNLMKFNSENGFDYNLLCYTSYIVTVALDVLICDASYPTEEIAANVKNYRQVGLGFANLGALLMNSGMAYDSQEGREFAAAITGCMTASSWLASMIMAAKVGPFPAFDRNRDHVSKVIGYHATEAGNLSIKTNAPIFGAIREMFITVFEAVNNSIGVRNSYVTNIAPTGTIGLAMGCDTTGIEPELSLVKYKKLVGGGMEKIVNQSVPHALHVLGYSNDEIKQIIASFEASGDLEVKPEHKKIFATSLDEANPIHWSGHIKMMAAVQPFLSGSISKTVNLPNTSTVEDVKQAYIMAHESGLKCIAIYRDGCKNSQPLSTKADTKPSVAAAPEPQLMVSRKKLPTDRPSITHKFTIGGHEGYITVGMYEDGTPGELFLNVSKEGSFVSGLLDSFATMVSIALQHGTPIDLIVEKLKGHSYEPQGITQNAEIRFAKSLSDYIGRFLELKFITSKQSVVKAIEHKEDSSRPYADAKISMSTPPCPQCGGLTAQSGSCHVCQSCGTTTGCS